MQWLIAIRYQSDSEVVFPYKPRPAITLLPNKIGCPSPDSHRAALWFSPATRRAGPRRQPPTAHEVVGYIGITCEAPIFSAVENGFFKEEGIEPELVKCEWSKYKDVLALGGYDITHHLVMYFLKPIEQGLDVKFTGGIHTGCLRVQASTKGSIHKVEDLRGKRIGVPGMGTPPFIFANRVLGANGIDAMKEIQWRVFPAGELGLALEKGEVDAVADSEPIGSLLLAQGLVRNVADQAKDIPYKDEYCCAVIANGKWLSANPKVAAAATRALLKGAKWVQTNPRCGGCRSRRILASIGLNTTAIGNLVTSRASSARRRR